MLLRGQQELGLGRGARQARPSRTTLACSASMYAPDAPHVQLSVTQTSGSSSFINGSGLKLRVQSQSRRMSRTLKPTRAYKRCNPQMCGIIGIFKHEGSVNVELYEGLLMLQHRGQDSAGMVTTDWNKFKEYKENGLVKDVFANENLMASMKGNCGIAHVRYPTAGSSSASEAQPFFVNSPLGIYLIHNGNLTNTDELRDVLNCSRSFFNRHLRTDSDSELLLNVLADEVHRAHQRCLQTTGCDPNSNKMEFLFQAGEATMKLLKGAYSCLCLVKGVGMVAFRDPYGIRPLMLGRRVTPLGEEWCVASEDCAFGPIGFERVRDVNPGEMVVVGQDGRLHCRQLAAPQLTPCIFEYIYLARPDSVLNKIPVYNFQLGLGSRLARHIRERQWELDLVCPVPDGSRPSAIQIAADLGLPYREGLVKNRYVGRTFIMPNQRLREMSVRRKLNAMPTVFEGKRVLLVDDSIVRGTTMSQIVNMVRNAGAAKVYLASSAPPVRYPNVYGVDMPNRKEFVAHELSEEQICEVLGADGLIYQRVEDLIEVGSEMNPDIHEFDDSCFTGKYCTKDIDEAFLKRLEDSRGATRNRSGQAASLIGQAMPSGSNGGSNNTFRVDKEPAAV
ncbi:phosphoribosyltransferase-like protein [Haematococcus lacustris]